MAIIFDGHNDSLTKPDHDRFVAGRDGGHLDLPRMAEAGMRGGIFAVFIRNPETADYRPARSNRPGGAGPAPELEHGFAAAATSAAAGRLFAMERSGDMRVARTIADIDAAAESGPPVAVLHLEGAEAIDAELEALELWYAAGLRSLGPVWSRPNAFGNGVRFRFPATPDMGPGLTDAGKQLVRRCAELGVVFDLAHMNEAGFWDAAKLDLAPLVVSHAAVHAICANSRNLTDAQIDAVGSSGGLIGIVFAPAFLRPDGKNETSGIGLDLIARHARYITDRIGVEHVALGSDFDGTEVPDALGDVRGLPALLDAFIAAGFTPPEVEAIAWTNWRRTLSRCWHEP
jgi:membrane dipeptidase